jgi:hypothetical protein
MKVRLEPVLIQGVEHGEGRLAFWDDRLVAVLVRLSEDHGAEAGRWFVEKGFGPLDSPAHPVFRTLEAAIAWLHAEAALDAQR